MKFVSLLVGRRSALAVPSRCLMLGVVVASALGVATAANAQNLITNGDFSNGLANWTQASWAGGSNFGINANGPTSTAAASGTYAYAGAGQYNVLQQNVTLTTGSAYRLTFLAGSKSGGGNTTGILSLRQEALTNYNAASFDYSPSDAAFGSYTVDFVPNTTTVGVWLRNDNGGYTAYDTVSVTQIASVAHAMNYSAASGISVITSALTGSGKVTSNAGAGGLTLSAVNTHTGGTEVTGGRLYVTGAGTLGAASGNVTVSSSGQLDLRNQQVRTGTIAMVGQDARILSGDVNNPGSIVNNGVAFQFGGGLISVPVSGSAGFNVTGGGSITGSNSYAGPTTISATPGWYGTNTLFLDNANGLGAASGDLTISGGIVSLQGNTVTRSGNVTISGGQVYFGTFTKPSGVYDVQGGQVDVVLTGSAGVTKSGAGNATLRGNNTYTGTTTITGGTLSIGSSGTAGSLGGGPVALASTGNIVFNRSDALTVNNTFTWSGTSNAGGYLTHSGAGTLALQGNQALCGLVTTAGAGAVTVSGGTLTLGNASGAQFQSRLEPAAGTTITVTSAVAPALAEAGVGFLYVGKLGAAAGIAALGNASAVTYGSVVLNVGTLDIVGTLENTLKSKRLVFESNTAGASVIQLSGSLTSPLGQTSGNIQVSAGADAGFAARTAPATINIGGSGGTITYGTSSNWLGSGRTLYFGSPTADSVVTFQNPLNFAGATQTFNVIDNAGSAGDAAVLSGVLSNGGLTKTGAGRLSLAANNTYTGLTTISAGTLSIGSGGTAGAVAGGILNNAALVFDRSDALTFSGTIGGSGGLTKQGAGTLTLAGNSSYAGATAVNVGGLLVDGALSGVGLTSVANGARFGGDGSLAGALTLLSGAQFIFNPSATLDVTGAVTLDNNFSVSSLVAADGGLIDWTPIATGTYTLIGTASTFNNILNFGVANAADIGGGRTAYFQNGSLQLVIVPEPGAFALAGLGIAVAAWARGRRRR